MKTGRNLIQMCVLCSTVLSAVAQAQFSFTTNNDGSLNLSQYTGSDSDVIIPSTTNGLPVTSIGSEAFTNIPTLISVTIPSSVTSYGLFAFGGNINLLGVYFQGVPPTDYYPAAGGVFDNRDPTTLYYLQGTNLWGSTFDGLGTMQWNPQVLTQLIYTNIGGQISITGYTGSNCVITIPITINGVPVTSIGSNAFAKCASVSSINIPNSVTNIGAWAFQDCYSLAGVFFQGNAPVADATVFNGDNNVTNYYVPRTTGWGMTFAGCPTMPLPYNYITENGMVTISKYTSYGDVNIPSVINGLPVTSIGFRAFTLRGFTNVSIPASVISIESNAFFNCEFVTNVTIPYSVTNIGWGAFGLCPRLCAINVDALNNFYSSVDGVLFNKSQTTLVEFPGGLGASYIVPSGVTAFGSFTFAWCQNLSSLYFQGNAPSVDDTVFFGESPIVYSLPGTTGWDVFSATTEIPAAAWFLASPLILNNVPGFGVQANGFGFTISWATNASVVVESSTDLRNPVWSPVGTNNLTGGTAYFYDPQWTNYPSRYYRLRSP